MSERLWFPIFFLMLIGIVIMNVRAERINCEQHTVFPKHPMCYEGMKE